MLDLTTGSDRTRKLIRLSGTNAKINHDYQKKLKIQQETAKKHSKHAQTPTLIQSLNSSPSSNENQNNVGKCLLFSRLDPILKLQQGAIWRRGCCSSGNRWSPSKGKGLKGCSSKMGSVTTFVILSSLLSGPTRRMSLFCSFFEDLEFPLFSFVCSLFLGFLTVKWSVWIQWCWIGEVFSGFCSSVRLDDILLKAGEVKWVDLPWRYKCVKWQRRVLRIEKDCFEEVYGFGGLLDRQQLGSRNSFLFRSAAPRRKEDIYLCHQPSKHILQR